MKLITIYALLLFSVSCASVSESLSNPDYNPSFSYRLLKIGVKALDRRSIYLSDPEIIIPRVQELNDKSSKRPPNSFYRKFIIDEFEINERPCFLISPKQNAANDKAIIFLHGGGFIFTIHSVHWNSIGRIVSETRVPVIVPLYPLYPGTNPEEIISFTDEVFNYMHNIFPDSKIIGIGDSAGAYIHLAYCHYLTRINASRFPGHLILVSPAQLYDIDDETKNEMAEVSKYDLMLPFEIFDTLPVLFNLNENDSWFAAPLSGDFRNFPPMSVFIGTHDLFYPLIPPFVQRVHSQGLEICLYTGYKMMHVWPYMPAASESKFAMNIILDIIKNN